MFFFLFLFFSGLGQSVQWQRYSNGTLLPEEKVNYLTNTDDEGNYWQIDSVSESGYALFKNGVKEVDVPFTVFNNEIGSVVANDSLVYFRLTKKDSTVNIFSYSHGEFISLYSSVEKYESDRKITLMIPYNQTHNKELYFVDVDPWSLLLYEIVNEDSVKTISPGWEYRMNSSGMWNINREGYPYCALANNDQESPVSSLDSLGGFFRYVGDSLIRVPFAVAASIHQDLLTSFQDSKGIYWFVTHREVIKYDLYEFESFPFPLGIYNAGGTQGFIDHQDNIWFNINENPWKVVYYPQKVNGTIYFDQNGNNIFDIDEKGIPNQKIWVLPDSILLYTNQQGQWSFGGETGKGYTLTPQLFNEQWLTFDSSYTFVYQDKFFEAVDIGVQFDASFAEIINVIHFTGSRCDELQKISLEVMNRSSFEFDSIRTEFYFSSNLTYIDQSVGEKMTDTSIYHSFYDQVPFERQAYFVWLQVPDAFSTGEELRYEYRSEAFINGNVIYCDTAVLTALVRCSYDPNDKQVNPLVDYEENPTAPYVELFYTIRFQNTGNDTAYTVEILDSLSSKFDLSSLKISGASHPMSISLSKNQGLLFSFIGIDLPDSTTDESNSHGYVSFSVFPKLGLLDGDEIKNTSFIYFDRNSPIQTNTTLNTIRYPGIAGVGASERGSNEINCYPNPTKGWLFIDESKPLGSAKIFDSLGLLIKEVQLMDARAALDVSFLKSGIYVLKILDKTYNLISQTTFIKVD